MIFDLKYFCVSFSTINFLMTFLELLQYTIMFLILNPDIICVNCLTASLVGRIANRQCLNRQVGETEAWAGHVWKP